MVCEKRCTNCRRVYLDMMVNGVGDNGICDKCLGTPIFVDKEVKTFPLTDFWYDGVRYIRFDEHERILNKQSIAYTKHLEEKDLDIVDLMDAIEKLKGGGK